MLPYYFPNGTAYRVSDARYVPDPRLQAGFLHTVHSASPGIPLTKSYGRRYLPTSGSRLFEGTEDGMGKVESNNPLSVQWFLDLEFDNAIYQCSGMAAPALKPDVHVATWAFGPEWDTRIVMIQDRSMDSDGVPSNRPAVWRGCNGEGGKGPFYPETNGITILRAEEWVPFPREFDSGAGFLDKEWAPSAIWSVMFHRPTESVFVLPGAHL